MLSESDTQSTGYWKCKNFKVSYRGHLDGGGTWIAPSFVDFIRKQFPQMRFSRALEWCCGPGFIGFALLAEGLIDDLVLSDINPVAISCVKDSIRRNHLSKKVKSYLSNNFHNIPVREKFDLIVANPPNYFQLNPRHPYSLLSKPSDLRGFDAGWKIHRDFYAHVSEHLNPGGLVIISEVAPYHKNVILQKNDFPFDLRPRPAIQDFKQMTLNGGLKYRGCYLYHRPHLYFMISQKGFEKMRG